MMVDFLTVCDWYTSHYGEVAMGGSDSQEFSMLKKKLKILNGMQMLHPPLQLPHSALSWILSYKEMAFSEHEHIPIDIQ